MLNLTNQEFCYWLQGYFEITHEPHLTKEKILVIDGLLNSINEPFGYFTQWLAEVISFFKEQNYKQRLLDYFQPEIQHRLNLIFVHVIDNSYETNLTREECKKIHDGIAI
ncbi:MAG: hypothetical protein ACYCQI_07430 [Gammaproteobacteria bacterium]